MTAFHDAKARRACMRADRKWLRRARDHFAGIARKWAEAAADPEQFRARIYRIGNAMVTHDLLSQKGREAAWSVLKSWCRCEGARGSWWAWRREEKRRDVALMSEQEFFLWKQTRKETA